MQQNDVILLIGSNIEPAKNVKHCLSLLSQKTTVIGKSNVWETKAFGNSGPNFYNLAVRILTQLGMDQIKQKIVTPIEKKLGRIRTQNKNAPRSIDIDIVVFNGEVIDISLWEKYFVALPVSELLPNLYISEKLKDLITIVKEMKCVNSARLVQL